jgi:hypothetical protein
MIEQWLKAIFVMLGIICVVNLIIMAKASEIVNFLKKGRAKL